MRKDIEKLKTRLFESFERTQVYLGNYNMGGASKERWRAQKIYNAMIACGKEGMDAILEIAESDHYHAAIFCCTQAYDLHPKKCIRELRRINKSGKSLAASIAGTMINMLRMGFIFDEPSGNIERCDFTDRFSPKDNPRS